jgi:hypothetical protein
VRNSNFDGDYESTAQRYESYMDKFQEKAKNDSQEISLLKDEVKNQRQKRILNKQGRNFIPRTQSLKIASL